MFSETDVISRVSGLSSARLQICLERGWVIASNGDTGPRFAEIDVARLRLICTMQDDMELDEDLLPTMLSLLDQVYGLRHELRSVLQIIAEQPEDIRDRIVASLAET